jgi:rhomboid protease GluP
MADDRRMCPHCRAFIKTSDRVCPYCDTPVGPRAVDRRNPGQILGGLVPHARFVTTIILLINFGLYAATALFAMRHGHEGAFVNLDNRTLIAFGASLPHGYQQWWRLITAGFLHGGILHILMNSWVLLDLGAQVEQIYGARRLIVIYFAATVFGFLASSYWNAGIAVGASAGIFGLIGAMIALGVRHKSPMGSAIRGFYVRWAIWGLALSFFPGVDIAAHLGGLAAGFACGYLAGTPRLFESWSERLWQAASYVCLLITAYAFVQMYLWFAISARLL